MNGDYQHAYFPVFLDLEGRLVVVVGGGAAAEHQVVSLMRYGADVLVIAPEVASGIDALVAEGLVEHEARDYVRGDLAGAFLVVSATDSIETARAVYLEAEGQGCLITTLQGPDLCNCTMPHVVQRGLMQVAVSTAGASPEIARRVQKRLEHELPHEWEPFMLLVGQVRRIAMERITNSAERDALFEKLADSDLLERFVAGERPDPEAVFRQFMWDDSEVRIPAPSVDSLAPDALSEA